MNWRAGYILAHDGFCGFFSSTSRKSRAGWNNFRAMITGW
jgi:hypothetical protein